MRLAVLALAAVVALVVLPPSARADGAWLDRRPIVQWNTPRMAIPAPPGADLSLAPPMCVNDQRPPETDEDEEVVKAGWMLVGPYTSGWGVRVITGASNYDGMCRPLGYQQFVFVNGLFAGTTSPVPMDSRTDGAAGTVSFSGPDQLFVSFARYTATDALCCPSRTTFATYKIGRSAGAPVLVLDSTSTSPTSGG